MERVGHRQYGTTRRYIAALRRRRPALARRTDEDPTEVPLDADERTARLDNEQTALPEVHALVRWQPSQGRVRFGHLSAYQTNFADQVLALMVTGPGQTETGSLAAGGDHRGRPAGPETVVGVDAQ